MRPIPHTFRQARRAAVIQVVMLFGTLLGCGSSSGSPTGPNAPPPPPAAPTIPALESVPFALMGPGKVAFERIDPTGTRTYSAIYVVDASATTSAHIFDNELARAPALSPDGRQLAYVGWADVYVGNIDGSSSKRVSQGVGPPTWTPDGAKIVMAKANGLGFLNVHLQSPIENPGDATQLTNFAAGPGGSISCPVILSGWPLISISSRRALAFACFSGEIDVLSANGTLSAYAPSRNDPRRFPNVFAPTWSPDETRLAFIETTRDSATNTLIALAVKVMNADGTNMTTVVTREGLAQAGGEWSGPNNLSICWMPDGSRLVFNIPESTMVGHLWVVRVDGSGLAQLTSKPGVWDRSVSCSR